MFSFLFARLSMLLLSLVGLVVCMRYAKNTTIYIYISSQNTELYFEGKINDDDYYLTLYLLPKVYYNFPVIGSTVVHKSS